jgi:hypothetical protein
MDDADHGLVGEPGRPQDAIDGLAQAQAMRAEAGLLEGVGDDGGLGSRWARMTWLRVASCWV